MQIGMCAGAVKAALGQATGAHVRVTRPNAGVVRLSVLAPVDESVERWADVLAIVQSCTSWGSTDATGAVVVWAELEEPQ